MKKIRMGNHNILPRLKKRIQYNNQEKAYLYTKMKAGPRKPNNLD